MKKIFLMAIAMVAAVAVNAEDGAKKVGIRWGVEAGYDNITAASAIHTPLADIAKQPGEFGIATAQTYSLNGFHIGPTLTLDLHPHIGMNFGLFYQFGTAINTAASVSEYSVRYSTVTLSEQKNYTVSHALQIPVHAEFKWNLGNSGIGMFAQVGPKFDFGLQLADKGYTSVSGTVDGKNYFAYDGRTYNYYNNKMTTYTHTWGPKDAKEKNVIENVNDEYCKWFDLKLGAGLGFTYGNMYFSFSYYFGVINMAKLNDGSVYKSSDFTYRLHEDDLSLAVGFKF